jgi:hypothetical protein
VGHACGAPASPRVEPNGPHEATRAVVRADGVAVPAEPPRCPCVLWGEGERPSARRVASASLLPAHTTHDHLENVVTGVALAALMNLAVESLDARRSERSAAALVWTLLALAGAVLVFVFVMVRFDFIAS